MTSQSGSEAADRSDQARTDAALLAGLTRREERALTALVESFARYVYGQALLILKDTHLAEEVAQDTLLVLWWKPERFDPSKGNLRSFLMGVARFKAIDVVRRERRTHSKQALLDETSEFFETPAADRGIAEGIDLRAALSKLSAIQRQAVFLAYFRGLTYREVAHVLEVPEGMIKTRIREGLIKLRRVLIPPKAA